MKLRSFPAVIESFEFFKALEAAGILAGSENITGVVVYAQAGEPVRIEVAMLAPQGLTNTIVELVKDAA